MAQKRGLAVTFLILGGIWLFVASRFRAEWTLNPNYSYGWCVPFLCVYLFWRRWEHGCRLSVIGSRFRNSGDTDNEEPITENHAQNPSLFALSTLLALSYFPIRIIDEANPVWRLPDWAMAIQLVGITLLILFIMGGRLWVKQFLFPVCFFLVAIPWPSPLEGLVVQSLMRLNAAATVEALSAVGIPVVQQGNVIEICNGLVGIGEACSGVRSLQATLMISLFLGELYRIRPLQRASLVLAGAALAFIFNVGRTFSLGCIAAKDGLKAMEAWHDSIGVAVLLGCFGGLWFCATILRRSGVRRLEFGVRGRESGAGSSEIGDRSSAFEVWGSEILDQTTNCELRSSKADQTSIFDLRTSKADQTTNCDLRSSKPDQTANFDLRTSKADQTAICDLRTSNLGLLVGLGACFMLAEVGTEVWYRVHELNFAMSAAWTVQAPSSKADFTVLEIPEVIRSQLRYDEGEQSVWRDENGRSWSASFFHWRSPLNIYERYNLQLALTHSPEVCITGAGKRLECDSGLKSFQANGLNIPFHVYTFIDERGPLHVFYARSEDRVREQARGNVAGYGTLERLRAAWEGRRHIGFRVMEVAVSGYSDLAEAEAAFRKLLPVLVVGPQ